MLMGSPRNYFCFSFFNVYHIKKQKGNFCLAPKFVLLDPEEQNWKSGKSHIIGAIQLTNLQSLSRHLTGVLCGTQSKARWASMFAMPMQLLLSIIFVGS